jgi:uncharacterized membrane protein (UPF0182 family)
METRYPLSLESSRRRIWFWLLIIAGLILLQALVVGVRFYTDWLWFAELGYTTLFTRIWSSRLALFAVFSLLFFAILYVNLRLAYRFSMGMDEEWEERLRTRLGIAVPRASRAFVFWSAVVLALLVGSQSASQWEQWLLFRHAQPFGVRDPVFGQDIAFYMFRLPFWRYLHTWFTFTLIATLLITTGYYYLNRGFEVFGTLTAFSPGVKPHLFLLAAACMVAWGVGYWLDRYDVLFIPNRIFTGAGYVEITVRLPGLYVLLLLSLLVAGALVWNIRRGRVLRLPLTLLGTLVGASVLVHAVIPAAVQNAIVNPNEWGLQKPYIERHLAATRQSFGLDNVEERTFAANTNLMVTDLQRNRETLTNVRIWDYQPLEMIFNSLQSFKQYYKFNDVDVDRYTFGNSYRQVMVAARELSQPDLPASSKTWQNLRLQYTHGYGVVMTAVNTATPQGQPEYLVRDIPPQSKVPLRLERPEIYYGEVTDNPVIVDSKLEEFDYPTLQGGAEGENKYTRYQGTGGIPIGKNWLARLAYAFRMSDSYLLLSGDLTPNSRLLYRRNIRERMQAITPFLMHDRDPYIVVADGKLWWICDAYTVSDRYPYARTLDIALDAFRYYRLNYIRNAVKVVIDAYNGRVDYYIADERDPMIQTYRRALPGLFKPLSEMPASLRQHLRYPEDLFRIQSNIWALYHMRDPRVFYMREDQWEIAKQQSPESTVPGGEFQPMDPYYLIMRLPGEKREEFLLLTVYTPMNQEKMIAWMCAKCDGEEYGKIVLYRFPKERTIYGPAQMERLLGQVSEIRTQLRLWDQPGSQVVWGHLLVIPIEQSLLYVKPVYLQTTGGGERRIPELKKVIVAYGDQRVMADTLEQGLQRIFGTGAAQALPARTDSSAVAPSAAKPPQTDLRTLVNQLAQAIRAAETAQREGNWAEYGRQLERVKTLVQQLQQRTK